MDDEDLLDLDAPSDIQSIAIQDGNGHPDSFPALSIPKHLQLPPEKNRDERLSDFLLPYEVESVVEMDEKLEIIIKHLIQCAKGRDFQFGFSYWNGLLEGWLDLRYPMKRRVRSRLAAFYYALSCTQGMETKVTEMLVKMTITLLKSTKSGKQLDIRELQLDWKPLYRIIKLEISTKERATGVSNIYTNLMSLAEFAHNYFPPHSTSAILEELAPLFDGTDLDSVLSTQSLMCHFLPLSMPTTWIGLVFRLWPTFQSAHWDEQWLDLLARLSLKHIDPNASDPRLGLLLEEVRAGKTFDSVAARIVIESQDSSPWMGVRKDVGIYSERQWSFIMTQCVRLFGVTVGHKSAQIATYGAANADTKVSANVEAMLKPSYPLESAAMIIVYSMSEDSTTSTPDCRALRSVAKLLTAMETFFHPSNHGRWSNKLAKFLRHLAWHFSRRWAEEARVDCPTPGEWRLTTRIKKQFVTMLSSSILMSMFSRDGSTSTWTQLALKIAAHLEPTVMVPPIVERSIAALEGLLETHRTTACLAALSAIIGSMLNSNLYPTGAGNLPTILDLLLPGIDPNDPNKTMHSAMLVLMAVSKVKVGDMTPGDNVPGILELGQPEQYDMNSTSVGQSNDFLMNAESSTFLSDWALTYLRRVLSFFENLPEPRGKNEKTGGKVEESTITFLCASVDELCRATAPEVFPTILDYFKTYICENFRFNMVKTVGLVASSLARGFGDRVTFRTLYPLCDQKIRAELEAGASSTYTMSTSSPKNSDLKLHWFMSILIGATTSSGLALLEFRDEILSLLKMLIRDCKSERGFAFASRFLYAILRALIETYPSESRFLNPEEWSSPAMKTSHRLAWGKTYKVTEVKLSWHVASEAEIDFALTILEEILIPVVDEIQNILNHSTLDHDTKCEFVKLCSFAKSAVSGIAAFIVAGQPANPGEPVTDWGESSPSLSANVPMVRAGLPLSPSDTRHPRVMQIKDKLADLLHQAVTRLQLFEDTIECVQSIVALMSSLLLDYPFERGVYDYHKENYKFVQDLARVSKFQKEYPRIVWIRRAQLLHFIRMKALTRSLRRSQRDDQLIRDLCQFCVSSWVAIRRTAQRSLDAICQLYDGTRALLLPTLLACLDAGTEPDQMKGALYVVGGKSFARFCAQRSKYSARYGLKLLQCQHSDKASIQALVSGLLHQHTNRMDEIVSLHNTLVPSDLTQAISDLSQELLVHFVDSVTSMALEKQVTARVAQKDEDHRALVADLLNIAEAPTTHWKYSLNASRILNNLIRRDQPLDPQTASYFIKELFLSDLPSKRTNAVAAITKILHLIKTRTLAGGSQEALLTRQGKNPLQFSVQIPFPDSEDYDKFSEVIATPMNCSPSYLVDKLDTGWLVCGATRAYHLPPQQENVIWDPTSEATLSVFRESLKRDLFWKQLVAHLSQEQTRNYLAADNVILIKSFFQIFRQEFWLVILPTLEGLVNDVADRHKQRAAAEIISGALRATKHWPLKDQMIPWDWFHGRIKFIYDGITPDSLSSWLMCAEYVLLGRDPRRNQVFLDFILNLETETHASAFDASKAHQFTGSAIRWPFSRPMIERYWNVYWRAIDHDYLEVRNCVSTNLRSLADVQTNPSFSSVKSLLEACQDPVTEDRPILRDSQLTNTAIDKLLDDLRRAREIRLPAQHGDQAYDRCSTTIVTWLWSSVTDCSLAAIYPFIPRIIPELLFMHEMIDNPELSKLAHAVILALSSAVYPQDLVQSFLSTLLDLSTTKSWKVRLDVLTILQALFFHQLYSLNRPQVDRILESLCVLLGDSSPEVREAAAVTLSGIVHCSERSAILQLKARFTKILRQHPLPKFRFENGVERSGYQETLIKIHSAVLGSAALINAFPYEVPAWVPEVLIENICSHMSSPAMISTTARNTLTTFKKTHQDTWVEGQTAFSAEELATLNDYLVGSSYYA